MAAYNISQFADDRSKLIVYGVTRHLNRLLSSCDSYVPHIINVTCLAFYFYDNWDEKLKGPYLNISRNTLIHNAKMDCYQSAYFRFICEYPCVYRWKFRIGSLTSLKKWNNIIGVIRANEPSYSIIDAFDDNRYPVEAIGFVSAAAKLTGKPHLISKGYDYGIACKSGDDIEMILDFVKLELRYRINGTDYLDAHDIDRDEKYKAVVTVWEKDSSIMFLHGSIEGYLME